MKLTFDISGKKRRKKETNPAWMQPPWVLVLGSNLSQYLAVTWIPSQLMLVTARLIKLSTQKDIWSRCLCSDYNGLWIRPSWLWFPICHSPAQWNWESLNPGLQHCAPEGSIYKETKHIMLSVSMLFSGVIFLNLSFHICRMGRIIPRMVMELE